MSHVPMTSGPTMPFIPDALGTFVPAEGDKPAYRIPHPEIEFHLHVPTWEDRDMVSLRMYAMGVRDVTADQIQNLIISELFEVLQNEDDADEQARFLEGYWSRQKQHNVDLQEWAEQEQIRQGDELESGKKFEPTLPPPANTTARERAFVNLIVADVTDGSQRLRDKLADQQLYQKRFGLTVARLTLAGWKGLNTTAAFDPRPALDAQTLTKATIESLRGELMDLDGTGAAWEELVRACEMQFDFPRSAEKNSHSPVESSSPPDGSTTKNTESESSDGSSTTNEVTAE
jgi:hypothetical protein